MAHRIGARVAGLSPAQLCAIIEAQAGASDAALRVAEEHAARLVEQPEWVLSEVLLSPDLAPHILAQLPTKEHAAKGTCRAWRRGWKETLKKRERPRMVVIGGEVGLSDQEKLKNYMGRITQIARDCIKDIGYEQEHFHWNTCHVLNFLHEQSAHIAQGVDKDACHDSTGSPTGVSVSGTKKLCGMHSSHAPPPRRASAPPDGGTRIRPTGCSSRSRSPPRRAGGSAYSSHSAPPPCRTSSSLAPADA